MQLTTLFHPFLYRLFAVQFCFAHKSSIEQPRYVLCRQYEEVLVGIFYLHENFQLHIKSSHSDTPRLFQQQCRHSNLRAMQYCNIMQTDMECKSNEAKQIRRKVSASGLVIVAYFIIFSAMQPVFPFSMTIHYFCRKSFCPFPLGKFSGMTFSAICEVSEVLQNFVRTTQ